MTVVALVVAVMLLLVNGFFVALEFALVATSRPAMEIEAEKGGRRAKRALASVRDLNQQVGGAQLGITMATLALGFLAEPSVAHLLEELFHGLNPTLAHALAVAIAVTIVVVLHMVIGEMVPKNLALANPVRAAMFLAPAHRRFVQLFKPLIWSLNWLALLALRLFGIKPLDERAEARTPAELSLLLDSSAHEGLLDEFEHRLLAGALELGESDVSTIAVPWGDVVTISRSATVREIEAVVVQSGHSRLPVVDLDGSVYGWVHSKDLFALSADGWDDPLPDTSIRPLLRLSLSDALEVALVRMQRARSHFALVVDADDTKAGIVTLEDILESVVGDIVDETDPV